MQKLFSAFALSLALIVAASAAEAGARQHFMAGQNYYTQGRYDRAITEFEEAYRLDPRPLLLFNISQAYERMGDLVKALDYLKRYLEADPDTDERATLLTKVTFLESRIASTGVKVTCNVPEATVYVDGKEVGKTPIAEVIPLSPGSHRVQISKKGYSDYLISVAISSGQTTPVDAELEPGVAGPAPVADEKEGDDEDPVAEEGIEALDVVPWVIAGVGGAAAIVGLGVVGGMAMAADDHDQAKIADIIGWPGVALAVGGTIWGIVRLTSKEQEVPVERATAMVIPVVGDKTAGLGAVVTF